MKKPLVSICLPNLNGRCFLEERMESFLAQSLTDWELIVCDSYSDDGAWEFFQQFKSDSRVHLYQVPRRGIIAGLNDCLERAKGKYIYIAPSDDTAAPQLLEYLTKPLERFSAIKIAVCDYHEIDEQGRTLSTPPWPGYSFLGDWINTPSIRNGKTEFLLHAVFNTLIWQAIISLLFRKDLLQQTGLFRAEIGPRADEEWALRASLASDIACVPGKLAAWRRHASQATPQEAQAPIVIYRLLLHCLESVLYDQNAGIPESWKAVKGWDHIITGARRDSWRRHFELYRGTAKRYPKRFLRNACTALREDPKYLIEQVFNGFTRTESPHSNRERALEVINLFKASWPPEIVKGGW
jgi:glycosyltransferase involved in cell wall biosynthesis